MLKLCFLFLLIFFNQGCNSVFYQPDTYVRGTPDKLGFTYQVFQVEVASGIFVRGWRIPSTQKSKIGTVVQFHGNAQNMTAHYGYTYWVPNAGFDLVTFDYEGYGSSDGEASRENSIRDGVGVLRHVAKTWNENNIFVLGQSLGGAVGFVSVAEAQLNSVRALFLESTFASYRRLARKKLGSFFVTFLLQYPLSFLVGDSYAPEDYFDKVSLPLLFLHGDRDPVVPIEEGLRFFDGARSKQKDFIVVPNAGHIPAFATSDSRYAERLQMFFCSARTPRIPCSQNE